MLNPRPTAPRPDPAARRPAALPGALALLALMGAPAGAAGAVGDDLEPAAPPARPAPLPHARQLALAELELGVLIEFGIATVAGVDRRRTPSPLVFHPDQLDASTWMDAARAAGARLVVLSVREPSGFCLWPSRASDYHVGLTPWRDGRGDLVREAVAAAREAGLAVGFKLSAADFNRGVSATPGRPGARAVVGERAPHLERLLGQVRELCSDYGPLALVWIESDYDPFGWDTVDAATGQAIGSGPGERLASLVRDLQPDAALVGTPFPDVRLLASERGFAPDPLLLVPPPGHDPRLRPDLSAFLAPLALAQARDPRGKPFDARQLAESWQRSVGAGATLLLTLDVDGEGHVGAGARAALAALGAELAWRHHPLAAREALLTWGGTSHPLLDLGEPVTLDRVVLGEHLALGGQRVRAHLLEAEVDGRWVELARGTTIGHQRVHAFAPLRTQRVRLRVTDSDGEPALGRFQAYDSTRR